MSGPPIGGYSVEKPIILSELHSIQPPWVSQVAREMGDGAMLACVCMAKGTATDHAGGCVDGGYGIVARLRHWLRAGYVEEHYVRRAALT